MRPRRLFAFVLFALSAVFLPAMAEAQCSAPPTIGSHPPNRTIAAGESTTLTVTASGGPLSYAWYEANPSGSIPVGTNSNSLTVSPSQTKSYFVWVTNACGSSASNLTTVTVTTGCQRLTILGQPQSVIVPPGSPVEVAVTPGGTGPFSYAWYQVMPSGSVPVGTNSSSITVTPATGQRTSYFVWVYDGCGSAIASRVADVYGSSYSCVAPAITRQPLSTIIDSGEFATLSVSATGTGPINYQWRLSNPTTPTTSFGPNSNTATNDPRATMNYYVVVWNSCGSTWSETATVGVRGTCAPLAITEQPESKRMLAGRDAYLQVKTTGTGPYRYAWYEVRPEGPVFVSELPYLNPTPAQTTSYFVDVYDPCGSVVRSNVATVTVDAACVTPTITQQPQSVNMGWTSTATLSFETYATGPYTVNWYYKHRDVGPYTALMNGIRTLSLRSDYPYDPRGTYFAVVKDACGATVATNLATVCAPPIYNGGPLDDTVAYGSPISFHVNFSGMSDGSYQWYRQKQGGPVEAVGANSSGYTDPAPENGAQYWAVFTDRCGTRTSYKAVATVTGCAAPAITQQPSGATITAGASHTMSVAASGSGPKHYAWYEANPSGSIPVGTDSSTLTVSPASTKTYFVWVWNGCGAVSSSVATVTVSSCTPPAITSEPQSTTIAQGSSATLTFGVSGSPSTFAWYQLQPGAGASPVGGSSSSLTVSPTSTQHYYVFATNECGTVTSSVVTVEVTGGTCSPATVIAQPYPRTIASGQSAVLNVFAGGSAPFTYQWYALDSGGNPVPIGGSNSRSVTVTPASTTTYYANVTNPCGTVDSNQVTVTVQ